MNSFTPDLSPIVGEAPELDNYFVAAGLNSIGILTGGGIGRLVAGKKHREGFAFECARGRRSSRGEGGLGGARLWFPFFS